MRKFLEVMIAVQPRQCRNFRRAVDRSTGSPLIPLPHESESQNTSSSGRLTRSSALPEQAQMERCSKAIVDLPLFPGYIFVHVALSNRVLYWKCRLLWLVSCGRCPAPLPDAEVEALREAFEYAKRSLTLLGIGSACASSGRSRHGRRCAAEEQYFRVVLTLSHIMHSMAVEIDACDVEQVNQRTRRVIVRKLL